ncbi:YncE family protein [Pseudomonas syringae]|uniref:DNA-binding beta-propeller fold protein YncE n=3 Tax=Pseudomonas syringae TaxID=317 RepID=A0A3M4LAT3_PSESF|nr:hypothetical protein [Pseudomonas syringae]EPM44303.1 hypothetical protein A246_23566 [Pseudomonas syringae pv. actinidiae ICMP 19098]EPN15417.1 hypothetical protein A248_23032 [Pseudomonas syringae pv. actinidiae ICMP 19100]EPN23841.1 hypothetical protein A247_23510 [Pseudomonas syringae pv. actinidiae ICMP 19099]EPN31466.1 hypothetical protein A243_23725 [Pseudomonas syringae pv. actinidiae ICMP 18883]EPN40028.1 hypothetical protein A242_23485 [Pseudomonas syringae pv. actinidiae ICMP 190
MISLNRWLKAAGIQVLASVLALLMPLTAQADDSLLYTTRAATVLPGAGYSWGFAALQPEQPRLYIARRENGLSVFDVERQVLIKTLDNSTGANAVAFAPEHNRAYVANMDGTLGIVALDRMTVQSRLKLDSGNLNNVVYDAGHQRVIVTSGRRGDHSTLYFIDAGTDTLVGSRQVPAQKLDAPIVLDNGTLIVPMRDENQVAVLSGERLEKHQYWTFEGCNKPSALAVDEQRQRLFVACRGASPQLIIADLMTGKRLAALPVTRAVNSMAYDRQHDRLLIPSGADASLTVIERDADGQYWTKGSVSTRLWAHNMTFDSARSRVYVLSADFTQPEPTKERPKPDPVFHPDTFTVMTLESR